MADSSRGKRQGHERYTRALLLLMDGGLFVTKEILSREVQRSCLKLDDVLKQHEEQLRERFRSNQIQDLFPQIGGTKLDDWDLRLLTGVLLEVCRTSLTPGEKREVLVIRNVRDELVSHKYTVSLDETTYADLCNQLEQALTCLAIGLEPAVLENCRRIIDKCLYEPVHMPSCIDRLELMCDLDEPLDTVTVKIRHELTTVVDEIVTIIRKAENEGRSLKEPKVFHYILKPVCSNEEVKRHATEVLTDVITAYFKREESEVVADNAENVLLSVSSSSQHQDQSSEILDDQKTLKETEKLIEHFDVDPNVRSDADSSEKQTGASSNEGNEHTSVKPTAEISKERKASTSDEASLQNVTDSKDEVATELAKSSDTSAQNIKSFEDAATNKPKESNVSSAQVFKETDEAYDKNEMQSGTQEFKDNNQQNEKAIMGTRKSDPDLKRKAGPKDMNAVNTHNEIIAKTGSGEFDAPSKEEKVKLQLDDIVDEIEEVSKNNVNFETNGDIVIQIKCTTHDEVLNVLAYMESLSLHESLGELSAAIRGTLDTGERLYYVCEFSAENMQENLKVINMDFIPEKENTQYTRSINLSMQVNSIEGLIHLWELFEGGKAQNNLNNISEALSECVGSKVTLQASLDMAKFKEAVEETVRQLEAYNKDNQSDQSEVTENTDAARTETTAGEGQSTEGASEPSTSAAESGMSGQQNSALATAGPPRGDVQIVSVTRGTRKKMLFDETLEDSSSEEDNEAGEQSGTNVPETRQAALSSGGPVHTDEHAVVPRATDVETEPAAQLLSGEATGALVDSLARFYYDIMFMNARTETVAQQSETSTSGERQTPKIVEIDSNGTEEVTSGQLKDESNDNQDNARKGELLGNGEATSTKHGQDKENPSSSSGDRKGLAQRSSMRDMNLSLQICKVFEDVGVTEDMVTLQRERARISECVQNQMATFSGRHVLIHHFGSRAEGTEMVGTASEVDTFVILGNVIVVNSIDPGSVEKVVLAEETRPGFVRLSVSDEIYGRIAQESELLSCIRMFAKQHEVSDNTLESASADTQVLQYGFGARTVLALRLEEWPVEFKELIEEKTRFWTFEMSADELTEEMIVLVPDASPQNMTKEMEWRLYNTFAERAIMMKMNIHQVRAYVLFKLVIQDLVNPRLSKPITAFIIKTIFLHTFEHVWPELLNNKCLILNLQGCINKTIIFLKNNFVPNFFIPDDNIIQGVMSVEDRNIVIEVLQEVRRDPYSSIASIQATRLGDLLRMQCHRLEMMGVTKMKETSLLDDQSWGSEETGVLAEASKIYNLHSRLRSLHYDVCMQILTYKGYLLDLIAETLDEKSAIDKHYQILTRLESFQSDEMNNSIATIVSKFIYVSLAGHLTCLALRIKNAVQRDWILCSAAICCHKGLESDSVSAKLKLITILLATGNIGSAREMLLDVEVSRCLECRDVCACRMKVGNVESAGIEQANTCVDNMEEMKKLNITSILKNCACCVVFLTTEQLIIPNVLQHELLLNVKKKSSRNIHMVHSWVAVDAKIYFRLLNTMLYHTIEDLEYLVGTPCLSHENTFFNILGSFYEVIDEEKRAIVCYKRSMEKNPFVNVASWRLAMLLFRKWSTFN